MIKTALILILSLVIYLPASAENRPEITSLSTPQDIMETLDERIGEILSSVKLSSSREALIYSSASSSAATAPVQSQQAETSGRWGWYLYGAVMLTVTTVAAMRTFAGSDDPEDLPEPPGRP